MKKTFVLCLAVLAVMILTACGPQVKLDLSNPNGQTVYSGKVSSAQKISVAKGASGMMNIKGAKSSDVRAVATASYNAQKGGLEVGLVFGGVGAGSLLFISLWPAIFGSGEDMAIGPIEESTTILIGDNFFFELVVTDGGGEGEGEEPREGEPVEGEGEAPAKPVVTILEPNGLTPFRVGETLEVTVHIEGPNSAEVIITSPLGEVAPTQTVVPPAEFGVSFSLGSAGRGNVTARVRDLVTGLTDDAKVAVVINPASAEGEPSEGEVPIEGEPEGEVPQTTTVPNVIGMTQTNAVSTLTTAHLVVGTVTEAYSSTVPLGKVISSSPAAGTTANYGSSVSLVLSKGPEVQTTTVPNVIGMTQTNAVSTLTTAHLVVGTVTEAYSSTVPLGKVVSSSPVAGVTANYGSSVDLVVSKGPDNPAVLGVVLITPVDGAIIPVGSTNPVTYTITGPNPVDVVIVNPDGKKSLLPPTEEELRALFAAKDIGNKEVYRAFGVIPTGLPVTVQMTFLYTGNGLVTVAAKDTVTGEIRSTYHTVTIQ